MSGWHLARAEAEWGDEAIIDGVAIDMTSATRVLDLVSAFYALDTQVKSPLAVVFLISHHHRAYTLSRLTMYRELGE